jgi:hypothetical protein
MIVDFDVIFGRNWLKKARLGFEGAHLESPTISEAHGRRSILAPFQGADKTTHKPGVSSQAPQPPANFWQPFGLFCGRSVKMHSLRGWLEDWTIV